MEKNDDQKQENIRNIKNNFLNVDKDHKYFYFKFSMQISDEKINDEQ